MFIVSAHSRFAPIDIQKARIRIARACRMTSPIKEDEDDRRGSQPTIVSPLIFNDRATSQSSMYAHEIVMHEVNRDRIGMVLGPSLSSVASGAAACRRLLAGYRRYSVAALSWVSFCRISGDSSRICRSIAAREFGQTLSGCG